MPNQKVVIGDNPFHNFMRIIKQMRPILEHISRKLFYPYAGHLYRQWKAQNNNFNNEQEKIKSMYNFLSNKLLK